MSRSRVRRVTLRLLRGVAYSLAALLLLGGVAFFLIDAGWTKGQLRNLLVRTANRYLTGTLEVGQLEGSLLRGVELRDVRLSRSGETIIAIESVSLDYSIRELLADSILIQRLRVVRPRVIAAKDDDGRWNLASLVRRDAEDDERRGPGRPISIRSIEVVDGDVTLRDPVTFGAVRVPSRYGHLQASLSLEYRPVDWRIALADVSWSGGEGELTMSRLSGGLSHGDGGWTFDDLQVHTPRSAFVLTGRTMRPDEGRTRFDLHVSADRFSFQEWGVVIRALRNIAIEASFETDLKGTAKELATDLSFQSNGGGIDGTFVLDTTVPGWHGAGAVRLARFNLTPWLNRPDRPSDISGRVDFNLDLQLGHGFPLGTYTFDGPHAAFMRYEGDDIRARGAITGDQVAIHEATARAYGADVQIAEGSIGIRRPYPFHFAGSMAGVDLQLLPESLPVPHVPSTLAFTYDATGSFVSPFLTGEAHFEESTFLGATVGQGANGWINTAAQPLVYRGEGDLTGIDLRRFGRELDVEWLQDPRYEGMLSGYFQVEGSGSDPQLMTLATSGEIHHADLFGGALSNAAVSLNVAGGSLDASYAGRLSGVDPAIALNDPRFEASISGTGQASVQVRDLFVNEAGLEDYTIDAGFSLEGSTIRNIRLDSATGAVVLDDAQLRVAAIELSSPELDGRGSGTIALDSRSDSQFDYVVSRGDLSLLERFTGQDASGQLTTTGRLTGPPDALRIAGDATVTGLDISGVRALSASGQYSALIPSTGWDDVDAEVTGSASFVEAFDQTISRVEGEVTYADRRVTVNLEGTRPQSSTSLVQASAIVHRERRAVDLLSARIGMGNTAWRLVPSDPPPSISWDEGGLAVSGIELVHDVDAQQRVGASGTWRYDGSGSLRVTANDVALETFATEEIPRYGGRLSVDAVVTGTRERPLVTGEVLVTEGRVRRLAYERLSGQVVYRQGSLGVDVRLDQAPGVWLTANGLVPLALFDAELPEAPIEVALHSSAINLGLAEGITDAVREVGGQLRLNVAVTGTSHDPHFVGTVDVTNAAFVAAATGAAYRNGNAHLLLATDRITVERFRVEDSDGSPLELRGVLGTHELKLGDVAVEVAASGFEVLRNELGQMDVDAALSIRGEFERPIVEGRVTVAGGELNVDTILDRALFRPYATEAAPTAGAPNVLNPWERLEVNVELHVPGTLRMTGDDVQVSPGTPLGLGSFNLRAIGDLYIYKGSGQPVYVTGSLDSVTGNYAFQGRRFEIDPTSSINFRGDLNPELYVTVARVISGVETRITIAGPLREPELRLASTPPLESSDILSLIVFNTSTNQLSLAQQEELAVRAGTLAAGFITTPLLTALERSLGLDILEIEAPQIGTSGTRVTIGDEIAPGLVARFSRQFGEDEYDEASIEYYLSRILRIRATFSDAGALIQRSPFRRVERAGIDLLLFFSF
jgi:hypothetical protein